MTWSLLPIRNSANVNASADVNTLQTNLNALKGGTAATVPSTDIERLANGDVSSTKSASYTILDTDTERAFYFAAASGDGIFTLPTLTDNLDKQYLIMNFDSSGDSLQLKGEGSENILYLGVSQNTIDFERESSGAIVKATSSGWIITSIIGGDIWSVGGTLEFIFTEFFQGTTDADPDTDVTHSQDFDKILEVTAHVFNGTTSHYEVQTYQEVDEVLNKYRLDFNSTLLNLTALGSRLQSQNYRLRMVYYI